jgi:hypothetical protein
LAHRALAAFLAALTRSSGLEFLGSGFSAFSAEFSEIIPDFLLL